MNLKLSIMLSLIALGTVFIVQNVDVVEIRFSVYVTCINVCVSNYDWFDCRLVATRTHVS